MTLDVLLVLIIFRRCTQNKHAGEPRPDKVWLAWAGQIWLRQTGAWGRLMCEKKRQATAQRQLIFLLHQEIFSLHYLQHSRTTRSCDHTRCWMAACLKASSGSGKHPQQKWSASQALAILNCLAGGMCCGAQTAAHDHSINAET